MKYNDVTAVVAPMIVFKCLFSEITLILLQKEEQKPRKKLTLVAREWLPKKGPVTSWVLI
jgi:hypothetical protein